MFHFYSIFDHLYCSILYYYFIFFITIVYWYICILYRTIRIYKFYITISSFFISIVYCCIFILYSTICIYRVYITILSVFVSIVHGVCLYSIPGPFLLLLLLLLCSDSRNDVPPVPQRNVSIAAERGAVRPSTSISILCAKTIYIV